MASDQKAISISIADLQHNGVRFRPAEAVTLVRELVRRVAADELPGIPSTHVTRLHADGNLSVEGPVAASHDVTRAARLLDSMVPGFDSTGDFRVSGPLRLVIMRALGTLDLPPYRTLTAFCDALERFGSNDTPAVVRALFAQHAADAERTEEPAASEILEIQPSVQVGHAMSARLRPGHITVSDLRRARRSTGVSLIEIAHRTGMPVPRLRELEWGLLRNWPGGDAGRRQVASYARAAGLDEQIVLRTLGPLLEEAAAGAHDVDPNNAQPVTALVRVESGAPLKMPLRGRSRGRWLASLAVSGLLGIGLVPAWTLSRDDAPRPASIAERSDVAPRPPAKGPDAAYSPRISSVVDGGAVSPDGERVLFQVYRDGAWVLDVASGRMRKVLADPSAEEYTWSPDGGQVAYHSRNSGRWGAWIIATE